MAIWFWKGANLDGPIKSHILGIFKDQFEIEKNIDTNEFYDFSLWYADVDTDDIWINPDDGKTYYLASDGTEAELSAQQVDWADISASYNDLTGQISISCSKSIPVVVEVFSEDGYQTFASYSSITSASFFAQAGKYRIRRNWANELEASNVVYLDVVRSEIKHTSSGEKLLVGRYGQLQVGKTPDDPDYDENYDKTYMIFGMVKLPFTVTASKDAIQMEVTPDDNPEGNDPSLLTYLKYNPSVVTEYLNLVKIGNYIYHAAPLSKTTLRLSSKLLENVEDERLYVINQLKIVSDIFLNSGLNRIVFEDAQMTMEDWGGTVAVVRAFQDSRTYNFHSFLFESGDDKTSYNAFYIARDQDGLTTRAGVILDPKIESITGENKWTADGNTTNFVLDSSNQLMGPIKPETLVVHYTIGGTAYTGTDDGNGNISGTYLSGTISYELGRGELNFSTAPDNGTIISFDYDLYMCEPTLWLDNDYYDFRAKLIHVPDPNDITQRVTYLTLGKIKIALDGPANDKFPDGTLMVDSSGNLLFKKGGVWKTVQLA